ncbi:MAG TPA: molybdopterin molybdotransferase MoeA [Bacillota bacterium]|jgi:molybdopterin molybdotransferase|nr:molybdopterin molybdotransferase MoeA [Bacillota bacterium]
MRKVNQMKLMRVTDPHIVLELIEKEFQPLAPETAALEEAGGRVLAEPVYAGEDIPGFDRSTVDGYAVRARDSFGAQEGLPAVFECAGEILMGQPAPGALQKGQCYLIHTGGMLPEGADAVIMLEDTETLGNQVHAYRQVAPGENVIRKGEDLQRGDEALAAGRLLRAQELGWLASLGIREVKVYRKPVMGLLSTGNELVPHTTAELPPGMIRDSNSHTLAYLGRKYGAQVLESEILRDAFDYFLEKSRRLLEKVDFLVFSGGSSVGARDFTSRTMEALGEPGLLVEGISVKPGKPTLLANCGGKPVLGLPGHPVSALVIFSIFGAAILERLSGRKPRQFHPAIRATLSRNLPSRSGRTDYVCVKLEQGGNGVLAIPVFGRSGMLRMLTHADGFLVIPAEKEGLLEGEEVEVFLWE